MQATLQQTGLEGVPSDPNSLSTSIAQLVSTPPTSMFLYLFPPCMILLALDVAVRASLRHSPNPAIRSDEHDPSLKRVKDSAHQVLSDFNQLQKRLCAEERRSKEAERLLKKQRNFTHHRQRLLAYESGSHSPTPTAVSSTANAEQKSDDGKIGASFTAFCDRLLLQNRIWKQQREIKALHNSLSSVKSTHCSNAFQAFCDRLIMSNTIWRLQREVDRLTVETQKIHRSRVAAVTRAAKQMVLDVRKERLIEEFVKDLLDEVEQCRQTVKNLRAEHEKELREMAGEWRKEYCQISRQLDAMKLAQDARLLEQGMSNEMESDLIERLSLSEQKANILDRRLSEVSMESARTESFEDLDAEGLSDTELELMSNMSTSSTCVGSAGTPSPNRKTSFDGDGDTRKAVSLRRRAMLAPLKLQPDVQVSPAGKSPIRKLDSTYAGFSFNPLFFGQPTGDGDTRVSLKSPQRAGKETATSMAVAHTNRAGGSGKPLVQRAQWRI